MLRQRRWRRQRIRFRRKNRDVGDNGLLTKIRDWWTRKQFYTFHKDEMITQNHVYHTFSQPKSIEKEENDNDDEWNNESESEDEDNLQMIEVSEEDDEDVISASSGVEFESDQVDTLETIDEESPFDDSPRLGSKPKISPLTSTTKPPSPPLSSPTPPSALKLYRNGTIDSLSGSLESMDSLIESQWDPDDDASNATPLVTNMSQSTDAFFVEHVKFLQVQTQPRKVEQVYDKNKPPKQEQKPPDK